MFTADMNASRPLVKIAEELFNSLMAVGQLASMSGLSIGQIAYASNIRAALTGRYLKLLETSSNLRFSDFRMPYCYNYYDWSDDLPVAGYTDEFPKPDPSQVLASIYLTWNLDGRGTTQCIDTQTGPFTEGSQTSSFTRLVTSALYVTASSNLSRGIEFLFDLQAHGFLIDIDSLVEAVNLLLIIRSHVESDSKVIEFIYGFQPTSPSEWMNSDWAEPESHSRESQFAETNSGGNRQYKVNDEVQGILEELVTRSLEKLQWVRNADTFDDWILRQFVTGARIDAVCSIVSYAFRHQELTTALKSVISQFHEISADAAALAGGIYRPICIPSFYVDALQYASYLVKLFGEKTGTEGLQRLYDERIVIPLSLRPIFERSDPVSIMPDWDKVSLRLAWPVSVVLRPQTLAALRLKESETSVRIERLSCPRFAMEWTRAEPFETETLLEVDVIRSILELNCVIEEDDQEAVLNRIIREERPRSQDDNVKAEDPVELYSKALTINIPENILESQSWIVQGVEPERIDSVHLTIFKSPLEDLVATIHASLCLYEGASGIEESFVLTEDGRINEAFAELRLLNKLYPWSSNIYRELGIAYDYKNELQKGLECMINCLILNPDEATNWRSLSVILHKLGADDESYLAHEMSSEAVGLQGETC